MRYIVVVFDGKREHIHKSIVADGKEQACSYVREQLYEKQGETIGKLWNAEAFPMSR